MNPLASHQRLSREEWLGKSWEDLSRKGPDNLLITSIPTALGVTKGSFYRHLKIRLGFVEAFQEFWVETCNRSAIVAAENRASLPFEVRKFWIGRGYRLASSSRESC